MNRDTASPLAMLPSPSFILAAAAGFATPTLVGRAWCPPAAPATRLVEARMADDFGGFEVAVREYVATLSASELSDADAPSPLAYDELRRKGRVDLVEGCMRHGGYIKVSKQLGLPLRLAAPPPAPPPSSFSEPEAPAVGLKLSGAARESRLQEDIAAGVAAPSPQARPRRQPQPAVELEKLRPGLVNEAVAAAAPPTAQAREPQREGARLRLEGPQRAALVALAWITALGYGHASSGLLDPSLLEPLRAAAPAALCACVLTAVLGAVKGEE